MITNAISAYRAGQSPSNKPQNPNFKGAREVAAAHMIIDKALIARQTNSRIPMDSRGAMTLMRALAAHLEKVYLASDHAISTKMDGISSARIITFMKGNERPKLRCSKFPRYGITLRDGKEALRVSYRTSNGTFNVKQKGGAMARDIEYEMPWTRTRPRKRPKP